MKLCVCSVSKVTALPGLWGRLLVKSDHLNKRALTTSLRFAPCQNKHWDLFLKKYEVGFQVGCGRSVGKDPDIARALHWEGGCPRRLPPMQDFHLLPIFAVVIYAMIPQSKQCLMVPRPYFVILPCESVKFYSQQMCVCMKLMKSSVSYSSVSGSDKIKGLHLLRDLLMPHVTVEGGQLHCSAGKGWCHQTWWTWAWFQNSQSKRREATPASCPPLIFIYLLRQGCTSHTHPHACMHRRIHTQRCSK